MSDRDVGSSSSPVWSVTISSAAWIPATTWPEFPLRRTDSSPGKSDGYAEGSEAVQDGDPDLEFCDLPVEFVRHEALTGPYCAPINILASVMRRNRVEVSTLNTWEPAETKGTPAARANGCPPRPIDRPATVRLREAMPVRDLPPA
jgi:hypothetical protein